MQFLFVGLNIWKWVKLFSFVPKMIGQISFVLAEFPQICGRTRNTVNKIEAIVKYSKCHSPMVALLTGETLQMVHIVLRTHHHFERGYNFIARRTIAGRAE
jgi:hypothetical protein